MVENLDLKPNTETEEKIDSVKKIAYSYADTTKTKEEKIFLEKRRRYRTYMAMDYFLSVITYFDFFSADAFKIARHSKCLAQAFKKENVSSELLFIPFLKSESEVPKLFNKYDISEEQIVTAVINLNNIKAKSLKDRVFYYYKTLLIDFKFPIVFKEFLNDPTRKYSYELNIIFEKTAENALTRFKTPVITSEILFITLMEEENSAFSKLMKIFLKTDMQWYLFRYNLMLKIHSEELAIRKGVIENQHYFAYLLKTQLSDADFDKFVEEKSLQEKVSIFRNQLIKRILSLDLCEALEIEIYNSMKLPSNRKYSS